VVGLNLQQGILSECEAIALGPTTREYETKKGTAMGGLAVENRGLIVSCHTWGRLRLRCFAQGEVGGLLARQVEGGVIESSDSVCSIEVVSARLKLVGGLVAVNQGVIRDGAYYGRLSVLSTLAQVGLLVADQGESGELEFGPKFEQFLKRAEQGKFEVSHANVQLIGSPPLLDQAQSALELSAGTSH
jgi:hypothetical protein